MIRPYFLSILFLLSTTLSAGDKAGNSCKSVICFEDESVLKEILSQELAGTNRFGLIRDKDISKITFIETLDLYEAKLKDLRNPSRGQIFPMKDKESSWDWIARLRARFEKKLPFIRKVIPEHNTIFDQILEAPHAVAPVDDAASAWVHELSNCTTVTTALQKKIGEFGSIQLDQRLFNHDKFSSLSKAVMLLHEIIYYQQMHHFKIPPQDGKETSVPTRTLIGALIQEDLGKIKSVGGLVDLLTKLGFLQNWSEIHPILKPEVLYSIVYETSLNVVESLYGKDKQLKKEFRSADKKFNEKIHLALRDKTLEEISKQAKPYLSENSKLNNSLLDILVSHTMVGVFNRALYDGETLPLYFPITFDKSSSKMVREEGKTFSVWASENAQSELLKPIREQEFE